MRRFARRRPSLIPTTCPRCGTQVLTLSRPIHASEETYRHYKGICPHCMTPEENEAMLQAMAANIIGRWGS